MALEINEYVDPGVYIGEAVGSGAGAPATQPLVEGIVAVGWRRKRVTNEAVRRGAVDGAALRVQAAKSGYGAGTDSLSAPSAGVQTLSIAAGTFAVPATDRSMPGSILTLKGMTQSTNNGSFVVVHSTATTVLFINPNGAAEASIRGSYSLSARAEVELVSSGPTYTPIRADRKLASTMLSRNGVPLADAFLSYQPAYLAGGRDGPFNLAAGTTVHAAVSDALAGGPPTNFPGPIAVPFPNRPGRDFRLTVTVGSAADWDGGAVVLTGTDAAGNAIVLTWSQAQIQASGTTPVAPSTISGVTPIYAISGITKSAVGAAAATSVALTCLGEANAFGLEMDGNTPLTMVLKDRRELFMDPFGNTGTVGVAAAVAVTGVAGANLGPFRQPTTPVAPIVWFAAGYNVSAGTGVVTITGTNAAGAVVTDTFTPAALPVVTAAAVAGIGGTVFASITGVAVNVDANVSAGHFAIGVSATAASIAGSNVFVGVDLGTSDTIAALMAAVTRAQVAAGINTGLVAATALGYGTAYQYTARDGGTGATNGVQLFSLRMPTSAAAWASDVRVSAAYAADASTVLFGGAASPANDARSFVAIAPSVPGLSTASFTLDYVRSAQLGEPTSSDTDPLGQASPQEVIKVGSLPGIGNYTQDTDWRWTGTLVDWSIDGPPGVDSGASPFILAGGSIDTIVLSIDGLPNVTIDLLQAATANPALGFVGSLGVSATAAQLAQVINAVLSANASYGPRYRNVASAATVGSSTVLRITSPTQGIGGSVTVTAPAAGGSSAFAALYGTASSPKSSVGTGTRPIVGTDYFVTYEVLRAATDYNVQKRYFTPESAQSELGFPGSTNPLATAVELAFVNNAPSVVVVQVKDWTDADPAQATATRGQWKAAIDAAGKTDTITDLVVLTTDLAVATDLRDHVEVHTAPTKKRYRRGWAGMAPGTAAGDRDTPDSYTGRATRTFRVVGDSYARGRLFLVAPPQQAGVDRDVTLEDGTIETLTLGGEYFAVAVAAKQSSFRSPAFSWSGQTITGFSPDSVISTWEDGERKVMSQNGVFVVTYDAGLFLVLDGVSTEAGGGALAKFMYPSCSAQKDNITRKVTAVLASEVVGIVPVDLADFVVDIKLIILSVLEAEIAAKSIAPFMGADGITTRLPTVSDVAVRRDRTDPTKFFFKYQFLLRYAALRLFGEYAVDNPASSPA